MLPEVGAVPVATLTHGDCQRLVDVIVACRTPEHARKALTALRVALRLAERYGEIQGNPCAGVRVPVSAEGERPARILTPEEAAALVAATEADDVRLERSLGGPLVALAFGSGLRLGELLALPWGAEGLDLDQGVVHVHHSLDRVRGDGGTYPLLPPKSRGPPRRAAGARGRGPAAPPPPSQWAARRRYAGICRPGGRAPLPRARLPRVQAGLPARLPLPGLWGQGPVGWRPVLGPLGLRHHLGGPLARRPPRLRHARPRRRAYPPRRGGPPWPQ